MNCVLTGDASLTMSSTPPYRIIASMSDFCHSSETARVGVASFGTPGAPTHWTRPSNEEKQKQHHQAQGDDKRTESKRTGFRPGVVYFSRHRYSVGGGGGARLS